jgi:hypothetical protein
MIVLEWQVILVLFFAVTVILFPAVFVWYLNISGIIAVIRQRGRIRLPETAGRVLRITLAVIVPVALYCFLVWFFYGNFGWQVALAVGIVFPIVLFIPALIWASVISGLYHVALDRLRRRATANRRRVGRTVIRPIVNIK